MSRSVRDGGAGHLSEPSKGLLVLLLFPAFLPFPPVASSPLPSPLLPSPPILAVKSSRLASSHDIRLVWAGLRPSVARALRRAGVLHDDSPAFPTLDDAQKYVEDTLLGHVHTLSLRWLVDKHCRDMYHRSMLHDALSATKARGDGLTPTQLLRWSARTQVPRGECILVEGRPNDGLYYLFKGSVEVAEGLDQVAHTVYPVNDARWLEL